MPPFFKKTKKINNKTNEKQTKESGKQGNDRKTESLESSLSANLDILKKRTGNSSDVAIRKLDIGQQPKTEVAFVFIEGIIDSQTINSFLIEWVTKDQEPIKVSSSQGVLDYVAKEITALGNVKKVKNWDDLFSSLMAGESIVFIDGIDEALSASTKGGDKRSIQEPSTQVSVRGPKDGFTESLRTNTSLVRRRIQNPDVWVESMKIGKKTKTDVAIMYINGLVKEGVVEEVRKRLKRIEMDGVLESGYIEQMIEDQTLTNFPTLYHTERPDVVAGNLLEGRVAIFVDGTPFVLVAPAVFVQFFQAVEDYYARFDIATALRFLRILVFLISILAPAVYIASTTFHQEMIPTALLIVIASQRESVPFPAFFEAVLMEITFEILREAGVRMPRAVGSAISIVGALVIGQAAVQAGIVSPAMVIIVSITAIASFATPAFAIAISARIIRFAFMLSAAAFGFYGITLGLIMLIVHLASLRSFGVPYLTPMAPFIPSNMGDTVIRMPWWSTKDRPRLINDKENVIREGKENGPNPPSTREMGANMNKKGDNNAE